VSSFCRRKRMTDEKTLTAAILGELIPQLRYAAPVLLERYERGEQLVAKIAPADPGFDGGTVDSVLLEFFKALVPYLKMALGWGLLGVIQRWRIHADVVTRLDAFFAADGHRQQVLEKIADLLARLDNAPVSRQEVIESFAAAISRIGSAGDARPPA
jgi:hypothetical protein